MKKFIALFLAVLMLVSLIGCAAKDAEPEKKDDSSNNSSTPSDEKKEDSKKEDTTPAAKPKIGFAQSRLNHPYRVAAVEQLEAAIKDGGYDWDFIVTDGNNDPTKQTSDVEDLIAQECDVIMCSPVTSDALIPACQAVQAAGIPLVLLDRTISSEDYDYYVGADNKDVGKAVAEHMNKLADGKDVNVMQFFITVGSSASLDRDAGFKANIASNVHVIGEYDHESMRDKALKIMEDVIVAQGDNLWGIFSQNDEGAMGILTACQAANYPTGENGLKIYGCDGQKSVFDEIKKGTITGTVIYPTAAKEAIATVAMILDGKTPERKTMADVVMVDASNVDQYYDLGIDA
jgi:ribose transport system substrate-binding protein